MTLMNTKQAAKPAYPLITFPAGKPYETVIVNKGRGTRFYVQLKIVH